MIEILLEAERALSVGRFDQAERLYRQAAEADPRNSIAVVGLARVALERADDRGTYLLAQRALRIDPDNAAAQRLVARLAEVMTHRGETPPADAVPDPPHAPDAPGAAAAPSATTTPTTAPTPPPDARSTPTPRRSRLVDRLLRRR